MDEDIAIISLDVFKPKKQKPPQYKFYNTYKVDEYTIDGEFLRRWDSPQQAADHYGISRSAIRSCARGNQLSVSKIGKIFLKEGEDISERLKAIDNQEAFSRAKPTNVPIRQYDIEGKFIQFYPNICVAADRNNLQTYTISNIAKGTHLISSDGKIFLRDGESIEHRLELIKQYNYDNSLDKSVDMYSRKGTLLKHWRSIKEAAAHFNISTIPIIDTCFGRQNFCKGLIFLFSGEDINERLKRIKRKKHV